MPHDVTVEDQGTVVLFTVHSESARDFVHKHVGLEPYQCLGPASFAVDHRCAPALIVGMAEEGLLVGEDNAS